MQPCRKDTPRCGGAPADLSASGPLLAKAETTASGRRGGIRPESHLAEYSRSEEHTSELQSRLDLVCRLLLEKKKNREEFLSVTDKLMDELAQCYNVLPPLVINTTIDHRHDCYEKMSLDKEKKLQHV